MNKETGCETQIHQQPVFLTLQIGKWFLQVIEKGFDVGLSVSPFLRALQANQSVVNMLIF